MIISIIGSVIGLSLILSGLRASRLPSSYPRWEALDFQAIGRHGAREKARKARLRWHLVAVNTALEGMERYWTPRADTPMPAVYRNMQDKRAVLESVLYN